MHCRRYFSSSTRPLNTGLDTPWSRGRDGGREREGEGGGKEGGRSGRSGSRGRREWGEREEREERGEKEGVKRVVTRAGNMDIGMHVLTFGTTYIPLDMTSTSGVRTPSFTSSSLSTITRVFSWVARRFSPTGFGQGRP